MKRLKNITYKLLIGASTVAAFLASVRGTFAAGSPYGPYGPHPPGPTAIAGLDTLTTIGIVAYFVGLAIFLYVKVLKGKIGKFIKV